MNEKLLQALVEKVKEHSEVLTHYAQQELGLSSEFRVKLTPSIKRVRVIKVKPDSKGQFFDQEPIKEDWATVSAFVQKRLKNAKWYQRSRPVWASILSDLEKLQKSGNSGYVWQATYFNTYCKGNELRYRLVRVEKPGEDTLYALKVARPASRSP